MVARSTYRRESPPLHPFFTHITISQLEQTDSCFRMDKPIQIEFGFEAKGISDVVVTLLLRNGQGVCVQHSTDEFWGSSPDRRTGHRICEVPPYALAAGDYFVTAALGVRYGELFEKITDVIKFSVEFTGRLSDRTTAASWKGVCGPGLLQWD